MLKQKWAFFINTATGRRAYNDLCGKCVFDCKQSFRAVIVSCPKYKAKRDKYYQASGIVLILQVWTTISITILGLLWMITVIVAFAVGYSLCNYAVGEGYDYDAYLFWTNLVAIIALSFLMPPWGIVSEISVSLSHHGAVSIIALLGLGLIPMVGSYFFLLRAFANLEAPLVVIMYSLDPIVAAILGYFVLGQPLSLIQILGMGVVIAALAWLQLIERKEQKTREDNPTRQAAKSL